MSTATLERPTERATFRFRLLRGCHSEKIEDPTNPEKPKHITYQVRRDPTTKTPVQPVFESDKELDRLFNAQGFPPKFERIGEATQTTLNPLDRNAGETVQSYLARLADLQQTIKDTITEKMKEVDNLADDEIIAYAEAEEIPIDTKQTPAQMKAAIKKFLKDS